MKVKWLLGLLVMAIVVFLSFGCSDSDSDSEDSSASGNNLIVIVPDENANPTLAQGTWTGTCKASDDNFDEKSIIVIKGTKMVMRASTYDSHNRSCTGLNTHDVELTFAIVGDQEDVMTTNGVWAKTLDFSIYTITLTPKIASLVNDLNTVSLCGHNNWVINTPKSIEGRTCDDTSFGPAGGRQYLSYYITDNTIYSTTWANSEATRSNTLDMDDGSSKLTDDTYETNNSAATAYSIAENTSLTAINGYGRLIESDNLDWYTFTLPVQSTVEVTVQANNVQNQVFVSLWDIGGNVRVDNFNTSNGDQTLVITSNLEAGNYYISMTGHAKGETADTYDLNWKRVGIISDDTYEENDSTATAYILDKDTNLSGINGLGKLTADDQYDYFKFTLAEQSDVTITGQFTDLWGSGFITLMSAANEVIVEVETADLTDLAAGTISRTLDAGTHYLKIYSDAEGDNVDTYNLSWTVDAGGGEISPEPSISLSPESLTINCSSECNSADLTSFTITNNGDTGSTLSWELSHTFSTNLYVFTESGDLAAGESATIELEPMFSSTETGSITVSDSNDSSISQTISVTIDVSDSF